MSLCVSSGLSCVSSHNCVVCMNTFFLVLGPYGWEEGKIPAPKSQWLHFQLLVGLGDAFRYAFLTSDWMCMYCHNVCNQTFPCLLYELDCVV